VQSQLGQVGVEVIPVFAPSSVLFSQIIPSGEFDVALFNWIQSPDYTVGIADLYGCGGDLNYSGYCQRLVTRDLDQARRILDVAQRARALNRADAQLSKDVPVIPLVERPLLAAFRTSVRNVSLDTRAWNPFANAENWWLDR
jgi:peptide/nickel transport system substrate-binding protein